MTAPYIVVIGSINMDMVVKTDRMPRAGETVKGERFMTIPGGKGANQAVAVSRMGWDAKMVAALGDDAFGTELRASLAGAGVDVGQVIAKPGIETGTATIIVDRTNDNRIIVVPGANGDLLQKDIDGVDDLIAGASLLLLQFEIPFDTIDHAVQLSLKHSVPVMLNPAPALTVPVAFLKKVKYLIVNEREAEFFSGYSVVDIDSGFVAAEVLRTKGIESVILTLGRRGALMVSDGLRFHAPARAVEVADTTAAGDTFVGAFAVGCLEGKSMQDALELAVAAGTLSVTRFGAQPSIPTRREVFDFMQEQGARV